MSETQRWVLLRNLKAASVYQFRVSAVNSVGEGPPSEPSNVIRLPQEGKFQTQKKTNKAIKLVNLCLLLNIKRHANRQTNIYAYYLAPSGPPVGFVGSARSSSEIITQWQPPLEEHR